MMDCERKRGDGDDLLYPRQFALYDQENEGLDSKDDDGRGQCRKEGPDIVRLATELSICTIL